ncbi:spermatogenesis-associated protein 17-like [Lytechinus variegatus]|uniref:spermatogenesis-associated protein 17-like n=1 Tax=Lytechinus variegatus TaxID=7654 RepID=UPI001BB1CF36|nr:spermatogenesis-associated protein 17-like [Lytechinus variegatus]
MATLLRLQRSTGSIMQQIFIRNKDAEEQRDIEYKAVVRVQAWFRGQRVRAYILHLHRCATILQKVWRGYLGRRVYRAMIKQLMLVMRMKYYNKMATLIQKIWKGYYTRKYVANYFSRKRYLEGLIIKNEIIRKELEEYKMQQDEEKAQKLQSEIKEKVFEEARKNHYLLSTEVVPGVYNSPFKPYPDEMEFILRSVKPRPPPGPNPKRDNRSGKVMAPSPPLPLTTPLPPIGQKPQGPFREPLEVQKQRFKPLQPTLRVSTSYTSVEEARAAMRAQEWVMRVNDNIFVPFTRRDRDYESLLHTTSKYGHLPYGSHYYRESDQSKHITAERFQPVVSPIPVFDKLNDTYSKGTETVP